MNMMHDCDVGPDGARLVITRRSFVTGMLIVAAAPAAMAKAWSAECLTEIKNNLAEGVAFLPREFHTTTVTALGTVVIGGYRTGALTSLQPSYGETWRNAPSLPKPRYKHAALAYNGGILVIGGLSSTGSP